MSRFEDRVLQIMELREQGRSYASIAKALKLKKTQVRKSERNLKKSMEEILGEGASTLGEVAKELKFSRTVTGMAMEYFGLEFKGKRGKQKSITLGEAIENAAERITERRTTAIERVREYYQAGERSTLRIAELSGLAPATVYNCSSILRFGLSSPHSETCAKQIEEAIRSGGSIRDVCARTDLTLWALKSYFARRSVKVNLPEHLRKELDEVLFEERRPRVQKKEEKIAKIKELVAQGKTRWEIAGEMGLSQPYISQLFPEAIPHFRAKKREEKLTKIRELAAQGKTQREIAGEMGLSQPYISQLFPEAIPHFRAKKREEKLAKLRELVAQGKTQLEIAGEMGLSRPYVSQLMKLGTINFFDQRGRKGVIKFTKTRNMRNKERAEIIRESLAQGERSLEELVKKAECNLTALSGLCRRYGISLPDDIIPYRYRPELDKLVDEGLILEKIAQRYTAETGKKLSRQAVEFYLTQSGQKAHWKKQQQEREKMETLSETEEQQRRKVILQSLELHLTQLAQKEGWACQKAVEYMRSGKRSRNPERFKTILTLFQAYETARQQGKKLSIFTLAEKSGTSYLDVSRVLIEVNLPTMCRERTFLPSKAVMGEKKKRVYKLVESGTKLTLADLEYFTAIGVDSLKLYLKERGLRASPVLWIKRFGHPRWDADFEQLNYHRASRIYEARDAGFSNAEALEYAEATERMREYALKHEKEIAPVITRALQMLFPEEKLQKPYRTSRKSLDEVLLESHDPVYLAYHALSWNAPTVAYFAGMNGTAVSHRYQRLGGERKESGKKNFGKMNVLTLHLASRIYQLQDEGKGEAQIVRRLKKTQELVQYALKHRKEYQKEIIKGLRVMFPAERIDKPYRQ